MKNNTQTPALGQGGWTRGELKPGSHMVVMVVKIESRSFSTRPVYNSLYTCKPHKYSLVLITSRIFSIDILDFQS